MNKGRARAEGAGCEDEASERKSHVDENECADKVAFLGYTNVNVM